MMPCSAVLRKALSLVLPLAVLLALSACSESAHISPKGEFDVGVSVGGHR